MTRPGPVRYQISSGTISSGMISSRSGVMPSPRRLIRSRVHHGSGRGGRAARGAGRPTRHPQGHRESSGPAGATSPVPRGWLTMAERGGGRWRLPRAGLRAGRRCRRRFPRVPTGRGGGMVTGALQLGQSPARPAKASGTRRVREQWSQVKVMGTANSRGVNGPDFRRDRGRRVPRSARCAGRRVDREM